MWASLSLSFYLWSYSHHSPSPFLPLLPSDQTSLVSSFPVEDHLVGTPTLNHNGFGGETYDWRVAALNLFVCVLTDTCTMRCQDLTPGLAHSQHPWMQPHFTLTSSPPTPLHLIAISILAINSLSGSYRWASSQCSLGIVQPSTSTQPTPLTPANTQPPHALFNYTKEPWLYTPPSLTKEHLSV